MAKISEYNLYNIDDLITVWKSGWQHLEKYANLQSPQKPKESGDKSKAPLERILLAFEDVLNPFFGAGKYLSIPKSCPDHTEILNLAALSNNKSYSPVYPGRSILSPGRELGTWSQNKTKLKKMLHKTTNAFATSDNYKQAFSKIATKANIKRFNDYWSQQDCRWSKGEYLSERIEPRLKKMMKWLGDGLKNENSCEEAWWNCLWFFMEPIVETMLEIKKRISADIPVDEEHIRTLNNYISHGYPDIDFLRENNGKHKLQVILKPHTPKMILNSPFEVMTVILLVQPAFDLAQQLQNTFSKSRFLRYCHAPSCRKAFYTGRENATACPGSQSGKKNKCSLEWIRYKRYLEKIGKNPEKEWDNSQLQEKFISYDND